MSWLFQPLLPGALSGGTIVSGDGDADGIGATAADGAQIAAADASAAGLGAAAVQATAIAAVTADADGIGAADAAGIAAILAIMAPDADVALNGWTDQAGGTSNIYLTLDEAVASDADFVQSPAQTATTADLTVRLMQGSTEIAAWAHIDPAESFATVDQTLTEPQFLAITNYANLFIELDDGTSVYRLSLANPPELVAAPVTLSYRFCKFVEEV